jgi:hypothetical protein
MRSILFSFRGIESDTRKRKKREIHESLLYHILLSIQIFSSLFFFNKKEKKNGEKRNELNEKEDKKRGQMDL